MNMVKRVGLTVTGVAILLGTLTGCITEGTVLDKQLITEPTECWQLKLRDQYDSMGTLCVPRADFDSVDVGDYYTSPSMG